MVRVRVRVRVGPAADHAGVGGTRNGGPAGVDEGGGPLVQEVALEDVLDAGPVGGGRAREP